MHQAPHRQDYLQQARKIKMRDARLLVAEGAFFLHRGDIARAVEYYLDALDSDPNNKTAQRALAFLKDHGDAESVARIIETGEIKRFFPPLGIHPAVPRTVIAIMIFGALSCAVFFAGLPAFKTAVTAVESGGRDGMAELRLTADEAKHPAETDTPEGAYRYILTERQIKDSYAAALKYFNENRDNAAQTEVNRILNSNAANPIRQKARLMMEYFIEPVFDSFRDNYDYRTVASDPALYIDCFVRWSGRMTNKRQIDSKPAERGPVEYELLVGDENLTKIDGIVPVIFESDPGIDESRSVDVLGRLILQDNKKFALKVKSVYQPLPPR
ncbi:MAG: hypothetical protein Pg6C_19990 [Treponemataceae bacterium]|nr:MAG: hypothetical protein Pg6C_19990 [Treponemataceae bacterium]